MARPEKEFDPEAAGPFGAYIWEALQNHASRRGQVLTLEALAKGAGLDYSHFHGVIKGRRGAPVSPRPETVRRILETLDNAGVDIDVEKALKLADILPDGYSIVRGSSGLYDPSIIVYEPVAEAIRVAAQNNHWDAEAQRRVLQQIQIESNEVKHRRGITEDNDGGSPGPRGNADRGL